MDIATNVIKVAGASRRVAKAAVRRAKLVRIEVQGESMLPSLRAGDKVLAIGGRLPRTGEIVIFSDPRQRERLLVKRVASVSAAGVVACGDNPQSSTDSRVFGVVPLSLVKGVARYRYAPPGRVGRI